MIKIGLLACNNLSAFRAQTLQPILADSQFSVEVAIINNRPRRSLKQKLVRHLRLGRGGYVLVLAYQSIFSKKEKLTATTTFCRENKIHVIETTSLYTPAILEQIRAHKLDVLLLVDGYSIIKEPLISIVPMGVLSYHHGDMRKYRGQPPAFWELYNDEKEMGITVQVLAAGLDCGVPVEERTIAICSNDRPEKLKERAMQESVGMLYSALQKISNKDFKAPTIEHFGKIYTLPNFKQWIYLQAMLLWRRSNSLFTLSKPPQQHTEPFFIHLLHYIGKKLARIYTHGL